MIQSGGGGPNLQWFSVRAVWIYVNFSNCKISPRWVLSKELFEECAKIRSIIPANSVTGAISREQWQQRWKKVEEDTSLPPSGLHFGHYIAGVDCYSIYLLVPRTMGFPGIEEGHCSGALGKRIVGDARGLKTPGYPTDGGGF